MSKKCQKENVWRRLYYSNFKNKIFRPGYRINNPLINRERLPAEPIKQLIEDSNMTLAIRMGDQKIQITACVLAPSVGPTRRHLVYAILTGTLLNRDLQRDVVYLWWPIAPSYMKPNEGGGGELRGLSHWVQLYTWSPINFGDLTPYLTWVKLYTGARINCWRSYSIFNLCC